MEEAPGEEGKEHEVKFGEGRGKVRGETEKVQVTCWVGGDREGGGEDEEETKELPGREVAMELRGEIGDAGEGGFEGRGEVGGQGEERGGREDAGGVEARE